ncbi:DUF3892 domain-containing protein [Mycobacterium sp. SMC-17]|uniref:DUF3892 domain-containing protein n=1 Tax=Mycobacterium sp. SMC-17 TaxID=3381628 RepID=UPI00387686C5
MSIRVTAIHLSGATTHEHIERLRWCQPPTANTVESSRAEIISWIETQGGTAYVHESGRQIQVGVVTPKVGQKYLRTFADGVWTDNLLALPRF